MWQGCVAGATSCDLECAQLSALLLRGRLWLQAHASRFTSTKALAPLTPTAYPAASLPPNMQRLADENREQTELIQRLVYRVDKLESLIKTLEEEERARAGRKRGFGWLMGGFSSARPAMEEGQQQQHGAAAS